LSQEHCKTIAIGWINADTLHGYLGRLGRCAVHPRGASGAGSDTGVC
jgi:hypothetical protein